MKYCEECCIYLVIMMFIWRVNNNNLCMTCICLLDLSWNFSIGNNSCNCNDIITSSSLSRRDVNMKDRTISRLKFNSIIVVELEFPRKKKKKEIKCIRPNDRTIDRSRYRIVAQWISYLCLRLEITHISSSWRADILNQQSWPTKQMRR